MASTPATLPSTADEDRRRAVLRAARRPALASGATSTPSSARNLALPSATCLPSTVPQRALAGRRVEVRAPARVAMPRSSAARDDRRRRADARSRARRWRRAAARSVSSKPAAGDDRRHGRLALGQRAGLVDDERVDLLHALERLGVLDQHAGLRAAPDADHDRHRRREAERAGTGDDQHRDGGDERHRRSAAPGPNIAQAAKASSATAITAGTNQPDDLIGQALDRRAAALRLARPAARSAPAWCRGRPSRASMTSAPVWFSVPPITLAPASLVTGIDSPVTIDSSTALRPSTTAPSTGTFSPGRTRRRSPTCDRVERHLLLAAVGADAPRGLRREIEQRADRAAGASRARAAPAPGRAAPAR